MLRRMGNLRELAGRVRRHEITGQFVRYATVGCLNVTVFFSLFNALTPEDATTARTLGEIARLRRSLGRQRPPSRS